MLKINLYMRIFPFYTLILLTPSRIIAQDLLSDLKKDWKKYNIQNLASIRLPKYIRPLNDIENKLMNGIVKEFQYNKKSDNTFILQPDSSLSADYKNSLFTIGVVIVDLQNLNQNETLLFYNENFIEQVGVSQRQTLKDKLSNLKSKIVKSYSPESHMIINYNEDATSYRSLRTKYIIETPLYNEPLTTYIFLIPNGSKSFFIEFTFPTFDSDYWYNEMESMIDEFKILKLDK